MPRGAEGDWVEIGKGIRGQVPVSYSQTGNEMGDGQLNGQFNDSQKETLEFIKTHEGYNTTRIADGLGKPFRTIKKAH